MTAELARPLQLPIVVMTATLAWKCANDECVRQSYDPEPTLNGCAALAGKAGPIVAYGNDVRWLDEAALLECAKAAMAGN
jgi:hypothetical protein